MAYTSVLKYGISMGSGENDIVSDRNEEVQLERSLVEAAANGNYDKIVELLDSGVSVDAEEYNKLLFYASKNYVTPLQIAAANGHDKCVQILIDHGADVNAKDRFDVTALHMAAEKGNYFCVKALLDAGADCCAPTKFSKLGCYTAVPHLGGTTPLHLAAANNHVDCVKELIQYGADYNAVNESGHTSLYIASRNGSSECVLSHLKNAVGRDILSLPSFETSDAPLHFAVSRGMIDCVKELLALGSDVNHINHVGCSPLHLALSPSNEKISDQLELLKLLVLEGYNADINCADAGGFTPLHYVCFNGYRNMWVRRPELAKFLIAYGANVNIKNNQGSTLLEHELKYNDKNYDILKYIIKSMLRLPRLKSLNLYRRDHDRESIERARALSNMTVRERELYREIFETPMAEIPHMRIIPAQNESMEIIAPNMHAVLPLNALNVIPPRPERSQLLRRRMRFPARQPLLMHVYDALDGIIDERNPPENEADIESREYSDRPSALKKQKWYDELASNPRTLQHHCRYVVRSYMGPKKLKFIKRLPIPSALQSYLLLETEE